jgi:hypothetical protein
MPSEISILGLTKVTDESWSQPRDEAVDLSAFNEGAIIVTILGTDFSSGTWSVTLQTAIKNSEDSWVDLVQITETSAPASIPHHYYYYLQGPGVSSDGAPSSSQPAFARYLRVRVVQPSGDYITLQVDGLLKP